MSDRPDVIAVLARDMEAHDHVPDLDLATELCATAPVAGGTFTLAEYAASLARMWLWQDAVLIAAIRRGEKLPAARLADLLRRSASLPRDVRDHIAARLEDGSTRGRPTPKYDPEHRAEQDRMKLYAMLVRDQYEANKAAGIRSGPGSAGAYEAALSKIAKLTGIPTATLDKYARPGRKPRR